jgi:hypothetical protein
VTLEATFKREKKCQRVVRHNFFNRKVVACVMDVRVAFSAAYTAFAYAWANLKLQFLSSIRQRPPRTKKKVLDGVF